MLCFLPRIGCGGQGGRLCALVVISGPEPTLVIMHYAAVQLLQSGHQVGVPCLFVDYGDGEWIA